MVQLVDALYIFVLSLLPIIEPRYSTIILLLRGFSIQFSLLISMLSCIILSIVLSYILPILDKLALKLSKSSFHYLSKISTIYIKYVLKVRQKCQRLVDRYGVIGLILFIAVPVPFTGMWTGAIAAYILGFSRFRMFISLLIGGFLSVLVTLCLYFMGYACISTISPSWS